METLDAAGSTAGRTAGGDGRDAAGANAAARVSADFETASVRRWFRSRGIGDVVLGFSGGIDSTVTALLLAEAGLTVHLISAEAPNQRYASRLGGPAGAETLAAAHSGIRPRRITFQYPFPLDAAHREANEAALPVLRVAVLYGVAAELRVRGTHCVVAGTVNFSEAAFLGFWGKASDGALDVYPISHLSKADVYALGRVLRAPEAAMAAPPSGDLLFEDTDDARMIGATYDEIEDLISAAEACGDVPAVMSRAASPSRVAANIVRNAFKYELPFPGFHLSDRLEGFRTCFYPNVLEAARCMTSPGS